MPDNWTENFLFNSEQDLWKLASFLERIQSPTEAEAVKIQPIEE